MDLTDDSVHREAILAAALDLGQRLGAPGVTMRGVAKSLGVSPTALYQHFASKTEILRSLRMRGLAELNEILRPAFALDDPRERIREQALLYLKFAQDKPWLYCLLLVDDADDWISLSASEQGSVMESGALIKQAIHEGIERGIFRPELDADGVSMTTWAALHGLALLILRGRISEEHPLFPVENLEASARNLVDSVVEGLCVPPSGHDD